MTERDEKMMLELAVRRLRASVNDNDPDCEFDAKPADDIKRLLAEYDRLRATAAAPAQRPTGADLENRVIEAITEWVGETEPDHALAAAREAIAIVRDSAQGVQEIDAWMRADGSAATVNPMTAGMWKAQGHTILPLYLHAGRAPLAHTSTDRVIDGLNSQLTEQFEISSKYIRLWCRAKDALEAFVTSYGSQDSFTAGLDKARDLAKSALAEVSTPPSTQRQCLECGELIPGHSSFSWCRKCREASTTTPAQPSSTGRE